MRIFSTISDYISDKCDDFKDWYYGAQDGIMKQGGIIFIYPSGKREFVPYEKQNQQHKINSQFKQYGKALEYAKCSPSLRKSSELISRQNKQFLLKKPK